MGWSVGHDHNWNRDIGYGVPATCDHPGCGTRIDRGLSYVCGGDAYGGEKGCGLFFCSEHLSFRMKNNSFHGPQRCDRCIEEDDSPPFEPTPDVPEWLHWKLTDESWQRWRDENPEEVEKLRLALSPGDKS